MSSSLSKTNQDPKDRAPTQSSASLFSFYYAFEKLRPGSTRTYLQRLRHRVKHYRYWKVFYSGAAWLSRLFEAKEVSCRRVLLVGDAHFNHFEGNRGIFVVSGPGFLLRGYKRLILSRGRWLCYDFIYRHLLTAYESNVYPAGCRDFATRFLESNRIDILLCGNDTKPMERLWIDAARDSGICSVVYQHGVWVSKNMSPFQADGWYADWLMVYDSYHMEKLIAWGMNRAKLRIVGFPLSPRCEGDGGRKVCVVGSAGYTFGMGDAIEEINTSVATVLRERGYEIYYRPHPIERRTGRVEISDEVQLAENVSVANALGAYDIFIGVTSTMLVEATLAGRAAIQIHHPEIPVERFDTMGYAATLTLDELKHTHNLDALAIRTVGSIPQLGASDNPTLYEQCLALICK